MELQWPLILFTSLLACSAGLFASQADYALHGEGKKAQLPALIVSVVLLAAAGIAVFFHLQHWERIFNGFGHITSGITQELIAIVAMVIVMVIYFVFLRRSEDGGSVPKWLGWLAVIIAFVLVMVCAHSYMMSARPTWTSVLQVRSLMGAAAAMGPALMALITEITDGECAYSGNANVIGQVIGAVATIAFIAFMAFAVGSQTTVPYWFDPVSPTRDITASTSLSPFAGDALPYTVVAIVGSLVGVLSAFMGKKQGNWKLWGTVGVLGALIAAGALRCAMYVMGVSIYPFF